MNFRWLATVERMDNGFVIVLKTFDSGLIGWLKRNYYKLVDPEKVFEEITKIVYEDEDEAHGEFGKLHSFQKVVNDLVEHFGLIGSKYHSQRFHVEIKHLHRSKNDEN